MNWFESQIDIREREDAKAIERAYVELAASVSDHHQRWVLSSDAKSVDSAVTNCLRHLGVKPGSVPDDVTDADERIDLICRPSGTLRRVVRLTGDWYMGSIGVMLGKLKTGEQVSILPRGSRNCYYRDPNTGRKVIIDKKVATRFEPEAIHFYRPFPQGKMTIRDLALYALRVFDRGDFVQILVAATVTTLMGMLPAWANQLAFGTVVPSGREDLIFPIAGLLLGVTTSSALIEVCRNLVMDGISTKLRVTVEAAAFGRLLMLPTSFFKQYASGNLASRLSQVNMLVDQIVSLVFGSGLSALFSLLYVAQIGMYAPVLAGPALAIAIIQAALTIVVSIVSARSQRAAMQASADSSGVVTALLNGVSKIKLAGAEDRAFARWAHSYSKYAQAMYNRPMIERTLPAIVSIVGLLGNVAIYYFAGVSQLSVADFTSFNVAYGQVTAAFAMLAGMASQVSQIGPMVEMVAPILEAEPEVNEDKPSVGELSGGIDVSNVSFRYEEGTQYVLKDLSFRIRPGEYVALVGKSGCGKSTIIRLLLGFEKPERGTIFYGRYDASRGDLRSLRRSIGVVMQDGKLFMGDIANNITISNPQATLDDAWEAAEIAGIADDIRKMPMGMQTLLVEGSGGISGGQRQRIMIARAVCGKRKILMFDEATSALDNVTQRHVTDSLEQLKCTRLVVAHRLSTVRHCDRILVVDNGHIAEEGTYEELVAQNGLFAELVRRQQLD